MIKAIKKKMQITNQANFSQNREGYKQLKWNKKWLREVYLF